MRQLHNFTPRWFVVALLLFWLTGCAVNPVTGQREISFISEREEIAMGQQHYAPMRQSEGGEFKVDPELSAYINEVGQRLAAEADRDLPYEFVVLNNSTPNAWALPGGKIAINRGLLTEMGSEAELAAVLGHEIVHSAARHGAQNMERGMLLQGALLATAVAASSNEYAGAIVGGAQIGAQLITQRYGRDAEREADLYGTRYMAQAGYDPQAAVSLQETFVRLSEAREPGWLEGLFASHPVSSERVRNNQQLVENLRAEGFTGGEIGEERYREKLSFLTENQAAYEAFDEAHALARQDRMEDAMTEAERAISLLPQEARFHGVKADILLSQRRYNAAIESYDTAIQHDAEFFNYYLGRGLSYSRQGNNARAQEDLQASVDLLPTAQAMNELGNLSLAQNNRSEARQYFEQAASAPGPLGEQARISFVRLDMAENPGNHLSTGLAVSDQGRLLVRVGNESPVNISAATLDVEAVVGGRRATRELSVPSLAAGQSRTIDTGLTLPADTDLSTVRAAARLRNVQLE